MAEDKRYHLIDALRGLALVNMLSYHFLYDVNVVYGRNPRWFLRPSVHIWQQYICWSFILIAGFSFHWGRRHNLRRGLFLNACGLVITAVTFFVMPTEAIWFGILSFMGCAVLLTIPLEKGLRKLPRLPGLAVCFALFLLLKHVDRGCVGIGSFLYRLPAALPSLACPTGISGRGVSLKRLFPDAAVVPAVSLRLVSGRNLPAA